MISTITEWKSLILGDSPPFPFASSTRVLDVGCGYGKDLSQLARRGHPVIGVDLDSAALIGCRHEGLEVAQGRAEELPVRGGTIDVLFCTVAIPYTDESKALEEVGRVLTHNGVAYLSYHGAGYFLQMIFSSRWRGCLYGLRSLFNTWYYSVTRTKLPGLFGDTLYQSRRRLSRYYDQSGLVLIHDHPVETYSGFPIFICHVVKKSRTITVTASK